RGRADALRRDERWRRARAERREPEQHRRETSDAHLRDRDGFVRRRRGAVIVDPGETERAALLEANRKLEIWVGRDRRLEIAGERQRAVELAGEAIDDLARHERAGLVLTQAGFHRMREQGLDLDDLALFGFL